MLIRSQNKKVLLNLDNLSGIEAVGGVDGTARITANDSSTHCDAIGHKWLLMQEP